MLTDSNAFLLPIVVFRELSPRCPFFLVTYGWRAGSGDFELFSALCGHLLRVFHRDVRMGSGWPFYLRNEVDQEQNVFNHSTIEDFMSDGVKVITPSHATFLVLPRSDGT